MPSEAQESVSTDLLGTFAFIILPYTLLLRDRNDETEEMRRSDGKGPELRQKKPYTLSPQSAQH